MFRLIINFEINNWIHLFESLGFFRFWYFEASVFVFGFFWFVSLSF